MTFIEIESKLEKCEKVLSLLKRQKSITIKPSLDKDTEKIYTYYTIGVGSR